MVLQLMMIRLYEEVMCIHFFFVPACLPACCHLFWLSVAGVQTKLLVKKNYTKEQKVYAYL
jgi:hypothetical protein